MNREDILKIINGETVDVSTLNKNNSYIITLELGDMPKERVADMCHRFSELLRRAQLEHFVIMPTNNGLPAIRFYEFKDDQLKVRE